MRLPDLTAVPRSRVGAAFVEYFLDRWEAHASTRSALVASQLLGLALCRFVLRLPPALAIGRAELVAWLAPTVQRYVTGPRPVEG